MLRLELGRDSTVLVRSRPSPIEDQHVNTIRTCLAGLVVVTVAWSADVLTLTGEALKGEIVSVSDTEVVVQQGDKKITKPIKEILKIDYRDVGKVPSDKAYSLVELTDGTQVLASKVLIKKKEMEVTLLVGPVMKLPVSLVANVLIDASNEKHRSEWKTRVYNKRGSEAFVVNKSGAISQIECIFGDGDETGTSINLAATVGETTVETTRKLSGLHGLLFKNTLGPKATPVTCKLLGTFQDLVMVSSIAPSTDGITVTTPAGAKIEFKKDQIARLDYTPGKLDFLSDLEPIKIVVKASLDEDEEKPDQWHVYKDSNLDKKPLVLGGMKFAKGLALKPYAELTWDLKGEYRAFEAMVGIDDGVSAAGATVLVIEGDGKEMMSITISADDKVRHKKVDLNIKDVQKLKIIVKSTDEFDTARHLDLADAKVRKE